MTNEPIVEENDIDPVFEKFSDSLDIEIDVIKQRSYELGIDITNGVLKDHIIGEYIYNFRIEDTLSLKRYTYRTCNEHISWKHYISCRKEIKLSISDNIGNKINNALIKMDNSFLLKRLGKDFRTISVRFKRFNISIAKNIRFRKSETKIDKSIKKNPFA